MLERCDTQYDWPTAIARGRCGNHLSTTNLDLTRKQGLFFSSWLARVRG